MVQQTVTRDLGPPTRVSGTKRISASTLHLHSLQQHHRLLVDPGGGRVHFLDIANTQPPSLLLSNQPRSQCGKRTAHTTITNMVSLEQSVDSDIQHVAAVDQNALLVDLEKLSIEVCLVCARVAGGGSMMS